MATFQPGGGFTSSNKFSPGGFSSSSSSFTPGGSTSSRKKKARTTVDIDTIEQLQETAKKLGVKVKEDKPSLFRRGVDFIQRPLYASAGAAKALIAGENIVQEAIKGIRGIEKETYSDVLESAGVKNKYVKGIVGFALDIALDPTTYFGGTVFKGIGIGAKTASKPIAKIGARIAPESTEALYRAGTSLKDALGYAFKYGYGTSKGLSDQVATHFNRVGIAKEGIVNANFGRLNKYKSSELNEAVNIVISNRKAERLMRKGYTDKTAKEAVQFGDKIFFSDNPKVNEAIADMTDIAKKIAKSAGLNPEKTYQNYFPFFRTDKIAKIGESTQSLKVGSKGYLKEFEDLIPDEKLLKKPIEAYSRRQFEVVRDKMTSGTLKSVIKSYGKDLSAFKNIDEAAQAGYVPIKDKFFGKTVGYLKKTDANFVDNHLYPEMKVIDTLAKASGYDFATRFFKTAVTAYFPAFHVRNYMSGHVQNYQVLGAEAFNPRNHNAALGVLRGTEGALELGGKRYSAKFLKRKLEERFSGSSRYISDIGDYIEEMGTKSFKVKQGIAKLDPRQLGNFIEMNQKTVATIGALRKGKSLEEAMNLAEQAGFNYAKVTQFEAKVMRRLVPFYSFARFNAELQAKTFVKNPERILNQIKFAQNLSNVFGGKPTEEDLKGLPPWALSGLGFKLEGNRYVTSFGLPLEEFVGRINAPMTSTLTSMNPIVKFPLESKMGYDFFRGERIADINSIAPETAQIILSDKTPQFIKEMFNVNKYVGSDGVTRYSASPGALHKLRNLPTARLQSTLEKMFSGDKQKVDKFLAFFSGARVYDIDIEMQKYFKEKSLRRDIEDQLMMKGIGNRGEYFYIKK